MEEIYEKMDFNRLAIAYKNKNYTEYRMVYAFGITVSDMARIDRYYYMELPEVNWNEQRKEIQTDSQ